MFYHYSQSNPGGKHIFDEKAGISCNVIIEADSPAEADRKAELIGIYFDGVNKGIDCSCCNDRWYAQGDYGNDDGTPAPAVYGKPVSPGDNYPSRDEWKDWGPMRWLAEGTPEGFIHFADGRVEQFWAKTNDRKDLDGSLGFGVGFNRHDAMLFVVGVGGWDESGNLQAPSKNGKLHDWENEWEKPDGPMIVAADNAAYGVAWFPTQKEAEDFVKLWEVAAKRIWKSVRTEVRKVRVDHPEISDALKIWRKDR